MRRIILAILLVAAVGGSLAAVKVVQIKKLIAAGKAFQQPPEAVATVVVRQEQWQGTLRAIASVVAVQGVTITPDIPGTVREITFESGGVVVKGAQLVRLDTSSEEAQLNAIKAQLDLAKVNLERMTKLRAENTVAQAELDTAQSTLRQFEATAENVRTIIEKKTIRAPFDGRLGIRRVNLGQYLEAGREIVSLQSLSPVYADFTLPQQELAKLQTGMDVKLKTDVYPGKEFQGKLTAINPGLDAATRSIGLQASFENGEKLLRPGMFARVEVLLPQKRDVLVIPATSVISAPYGDSVYVVETKPATTNAPECLVARQQFVRTGEGRGDFLVVESGLTAGQRIVSAGVFKLRNGVGVVESNELVPKAAEAPKPSDS